MTLAGFVATHTVPDAGLDAWEVPDPRLPPSATLDPWLDVQVTATEAGWTRVLCPNGWSAWVNGATLVPASVGPAAAVADNPVAPAAMQPTAWLAIAGAAAVAVSAVLPWVSLGQGALGSVTANAFKVPVELLWNVQASSLGRGATSALTVGLALVAVGCAGAGLVFGPPSLDLLRRAAGGLAVVIATDFVRQVSAALGQLERAGAGRVSVFRVLGTGVYVALAGGLVMLVGTTRHASRPEGHP